MQIMLQLCARTGTKENLKTWALNELGPRLIESEQSIQRLIVNLAVPAPANGPYGTDESLEGDDFDVVLQLWFNQPEESQSVMQSLERDFLERADSWHGYRITDTEVINRTLPTRDGPTPGLKLIRGLYLFDDLPDTAAKRMWSHHSALAVKVHVGLSRYARHWVDEVLTVGSPAIRGLSDLHFPSEEALRERYFDSPRGREEIWHDIGHFIKSGTKRFYGQEWILK